MTDETERFMLERCNCMVLQGFDNLVSFDNFGTFNEVSYFGSRFLT